METFLRLRDIDKHFPGVHALKEVNFELNKGECVALLGENGAGKSTLIKVLGGAHRPDSGEIWLGGKEMFFEKPTDSLAAGIAIIYQEFNLVPGLSVVENIFLGMKWSVAKWRPFHKKKVLVFFKNILFICFPVILQGLF